MQIIQIKLSNLWPFLKLTFFIEAGENVSQCKFNK